MFVRYLLTVPVTKNLNGFLKNNSDCYWKKRNGENVPNIFLHMSILFTSGNFHQYNMCEVTCNEY